MLVVSGTEALQAFRENWTGERMLDLIRQHNGRVRVDWAIGVGKSSNLDQTIEAAIRLDQYDLVTALLPTRQIIQERSWIKNPPINVRITNLQPRPRKRCGELDVRWKIFETNGLGALGRIQICGVCPRRRGCHWPEQYGKKLQGVRVIFGTQAHLERAPAFMFQLTRWTGAKRVLALLDEVNFIMTSFRQSISCTKLVQFIEVLSSLNPLKWGRTHRDWLYRCALLLRASTKDLRCPDWQMPPIFPSWSIAVQSCGWSRYSEAFKFLGYDLQQFGYSPLTSREKNGSGDLLFAAPPYLNCDFVIYTGTAHPEFSRFRLGSDLANPFQDYRFEHPETVWYNIASRLGTRTHFLHNADQILYFFAALVARRLREGRRPLLIAKKCFVQICAAGMKHRLKELGFPDARVITDNWNAVDLSDPHVLPLVNYGVVGINLFQNFDCAYCLTGYYVTEDVVNTVLQDVLASDAYIPIKITTGGNPRRRHASVVNPSDRVYDVHRLAQLALSQQEMDVVLQAAGRVRPYTRPREVITFQCGEHPQLTYTKEFNSIGEARIFFGNPSRRVHSQLQNVERIRTAKQKGLTQSQAAEEVGVSISTVKRYWNSGEVSRTLPNIL